MQSNIRADFSEQNIFKTLKIFFSHVAHYNSLILVNNFNKQVPNIAIMGSGGGIRAVIGMCGAVTALQDENLLDSTMFAAGVSGSAW